MRYVRAKETGAAVGVFIPTQSAGEHFDRAYDHAQELFHSVEIGRIGPWLRFASSLAWPRTTHRPCPCPEYPWPGLTVEDRGVLSRSHFERAARRKEQQTARSGELAPV